jgi:hypothetical protein
MKRRAMASTAAGNRSTERGEHSRDSLECSFLGVARTINALPNSHLDGIHVKGLLQEVLVVRESLPGKFGCKNVFC